MVRFVLEQRLLWEQQRTELCGYRCNGEKEAGDAWVMGGVLALTCRDSGL